MQTTRVAVFVDGSNLHGALSSMDLQVDRYDSFYSYIAAEAVDSWRDSLILGRDSFTPVQLHRVYWYVVGSIAEWNLADTRAQDALKQIFDRAVEVKAAFCREAADALESRGASPTDAEVQAEAFHRFHRDRSNWYASRLRTLDGMKRFHHGVASSTDFIEIIPAGHWKVDLASKTLEEKGLDAALSVDMVTRVDQYDVALVLSGDADMLPSIRYCKSVGKHVGVIELVNGHPPEDRGRGFSSRLRVDADFVARIYETELHRKEFTTSRTTTTARPRATTSA